MKIEARNKTRTQLAVYRVYTSFCIFGRCISNQIFFARRDENFRSLWSSETCFAVYSETKASSKVSEGFDVKCQAGLWLNPFFLWNFSPWLNEVHRRRIGISCASFHRYWLSLQKVFFGWATSLCLIVTVYMIWAQIFRTIQIIWCVSFQLNKI